MNKGKIELDEKKEALSVYSENASFSLIRFTWFNPQI